MLNLVHTRKEGDYTEKYPKKKKRKSRKLTLQTTADVPKDVKRHRILRITLYENIAIRNMRATSASYRKLMTTVFIIV